MCVDECVRVLTCAPAQAEPHSAWERGNVGSTEGLLQGSSYTQKTLENGYPHSPTSLPTAPDLKELCAWLSHVYFRPNSPKAIHFPSHLLLQLSCPWGVQSTSGPRPGRILGIFRVFPSCCLPLSPTLPLQPFSHFCCFYHLPQPPPLPPVYPTASAEFTALIVPTWVTAVPSLAPPPSGTH